MDYLHGPFPILQGAGQETLGEQKQFRTGTERLNVPFGMIGYQ